MWFCVCFISLGVRGWGGRLPISLMGMCHLCNSEVLQWDRFGGGGGGVCVCVLGGGSLHMPGVSARYACVCTRCFLNFVQRKK